MISTAEQIDAFLLKSKIEEAIDLFLKSTKEYQWNDLYNSVALQSTIFHTCERDLNNQKISHQDATMQRSRIVVALQTNLKEYRQNCVVLENDLKTLHAKEIQTLQNKIQVLEQEKAELTRNSISQRSGISEEIKVLEEKIRSLEAENQELTRNTISLRNGISTLEKENLALLEKIKVLENSRNNISSRNVISEPQNLEKFEINGVAFELIYVEGGKFMMGSDSRDDEKPIHEVTVSDFWIGKHPVTQAQWEVIMGNNPSHFKGSTLPVESVCWYDCQEFLKKLNEKIKTTSPNPSLKGGESSNSPLFKGGQGGFRLPTEEEWEYAARGGNKSQGFKYAGSNNIDEVAWYKENSGEKTHPVCTKKPNELGIFDMSGNVWEWTNSGCLEIFDMQLRSIDEYFLRGGSWGLKAYYCQTIKHFNNFSEDRGYGVGFRFCVGL